MLIYLGPLLPYQQGCLLNVLFALYSQLFFPRKDDSLDIIQKGVCFLKNCIVVILVCNDSNFVLACQIKRANLFEHLSIWAVSDCSVNVLESISKCVLDIDLVILFLYWGYFKRTPRIEMLECCVVVEELLSQIFLLHQQFYLFYSFSNSEIQNIVKSMSTQPYLHPSQEFYAQSSDRKRTSSLYNQLSSASRQNLQVTNRQNIINQGFGYPKSNNFLSNPAFKQNQFKSIHLQHSQATKQPQATKLLAQNSALKQQIERQKQKYDLQITQLKRNLSLKDELLDDCQKQIINLKATYLKLIQQYEQFKMSEETTRSIENQSNTPTQKTEIIPKSPEGNLIPLSIKTRSSGNGEVGKLTHGLIRGRV